MRPVWYGNRTILHWMQVQAMRNRNVLLAPGEFAGVTTETWRGIPIEISDQVLNTESTLT